MAYRQGGGKGYPMRVQDEYTTDEALSSDTLQHVPRALYQQARRNGVKGRKQQPRRDGGGYGSGRNQSRAGSSSDTGGASDTTAPWLKIRPMQPHEMQEVSLAEEVMKFGEFMSLTPSEQAVRNVMKQTLQQLANQLWPNSSVKIYGSFAYGLSLPSSDMDMVIEDCTPSLTETFPEFIELCKGSGFTIVGDLTGTFLKLKDESSNLVGNITFTSDKSPVRKSVAVIRTMLEKYPAASAVIMVIRTVLSQCNLVDVPSGGISSFAVILMTFFACQNCGVGSNAGELLKAFLRLFGVDFDFAQSSVMLNIESDEGYGFVPKKHAGSMISVCDPLDGVNNVAEQCRRLAQIKSMFKYCHMALGKWEPPSSEQFRGRTPLSTIIAHNALWSRLTKFQPQAEVHP